MPRLAPLQLGGVPEHFNLPWHLALESGTLHNIACRWENQPGGTGEMLDKLGSGDLDVVSILTEGTVAAIADELPVTIVQVYVDSPLQWGMHVPAASAFTDPLQLAGARIAISRLQSGSHLMARVMARRLGWALDHDQLVLVGGLDGARDSAGEDRWDLFLWDRFMTQPLVDDGTLRRIGVEPTPWPPFVIAVRNEVLHGRTTEVGRVIDAVVAEATSLHVQPDIPDRLVRDYGITDAGAREWLAATSFATRAAVDPAMLASTLAIVRP